MRPLTLDERAILTTLRVARPQGSAGFGAFLAFLVTLGVLLILAPADWQTGVRSLTPVASALAVAALVFRRLRHSTHHRDWYKRIDRDLAGGVARVSTAHVLDAIRVREFEDEGSSYYLLLDDHRVLFLLGQYLDDVEEDGRFPSSVVTVIRALATGIVFDITCEGTPIAPSSERPPFSTDDYDKGRVPSDGSALDIDFESLRFPPKFEESSPAG